MRVEECWVNVGIIIRSVFFSFYSFVFYFFSFIFRVGFVIDYFFNYENVYGGFGR